MSRSCWWTKRGDRPNVEGSAGPERRSRRSSGEAGPVCVAVGLSGGVDSAVAALLLMQSGYRVIGVTLGLWVGEESDRSSACCSPGAVDRAKAVADHLGIPHYAFDQRETFSQQVVEYFVAEYAAGRTPNPCVKCNARVRFGALLEIADRVGAQRVATGHYARLRGKPPRLSRGVDRKKDQSYVLAEVGPELLEKCIFPLGGYTKKQVRRLAAKAGLDSVVSAESQEICFVPRDDYRAFLRSSLGERPGLVVDEYGTELATHTGIYNFTIGQRKGLGIGGGESYYVVGVDAETARVTVSREADADSRRISFKGEVRHRGLGRGRMWAQVRSTSSPVRGRLVGERAFVVGEPVESVATGQTIAVYRGKDLVLGATIEGAEGDRSADGRRGRTAENRAYGIFKALTGR